MESTSTDIVGGWMKSDWQEVKTIEGKPRRVDKILIHLTEHVTYPASKHDIVSTGDGMSCLPFEQDRIWLERNLDDKVYKNAGEAARSLGLR